MTLRNTMLWSSVIFGMLTIFLLLVIVAVTAEVVYSGINQKDALTPVYTPAQCQAEGGKVRNTLLSSGTCPQGEKSIGIVEGVNCPCNCCLPD